MKKCFLLLVVLFAINVLAEEVPKYPVSTIPETLLKDVNAVVREDKMVYKIFARNRASVYGKFVVTILNQNGKFFAYRNIGYDKLSKIKSIHAAAYDQHGTLIKKLKSNEITDQSAYDGYTLYSDNRVKSMDLSQNTYPYTVEFEYEMEYKFLYSIDGSVIIPSEKTSVENASYQLIYPPALAPHYKTFNILQQPAKENIEGFESLLWTFKNLAPIKVEPLGPDLSQLAPKIFAAPSAFEYEGYVGNMTDWKFYGKWLSELYEGRDELTPATKDKVKILTKDLNAPEEKVKVLYEFLQSKTRYVSIQLGIGGLQPFPASVVDQNGYGDCKALSNYMVALLKEAGIKGHYAMVMAGPDEQPILSDYPSHQFNHVIVAVPNEKDTLWLECTSQTNPFGYLGSFTGDRKALVISEQGGKLVNTAKYNGENNLKYRTGAVTLTSNGNASAKIRTTYKGLRYETKGLSSVIYGSHDEKKKWIQQNTQIPTFDVNGFSVKEIRAKSPVAVVELDLGLNRYATVSGKRLFITPNLMNRSTYIPEKVDTRKTNIVSKVSYCDLDTIRYSIPENIYPEFLPAEIKLNTRFGEYEAKFELQEGVLIYTRRLNINKGEFPADSYQELTDFYKSINKADHTKIVFLNKT